MKLDCQSISPFQLEQNRIGQFDSGEASVDFADLEWNKAGFLAVDLELPAGIQQYSERKLYDGRRRLSIID